VLYEHWPVRVLMQERAYPPPPQLPNVDADLARAGRLLPRAAVARLRPVLRARCLAVRLRHGGVGWPPPAGRPAVAAEEDEEGFEWAEPEEGDPPAARVAAAAGGGGLRRSGARAFERWIKVCVRVCVRAHKCA
jgi:hypothetical protein